MPAATHPSTHLMLRRNEAASGEPLDIYGTDMYFKLNGTDTEGRFALMENAVPPGSATPMHVHHREDESFRVLEGEFLFVIDGEHIRAVEGDFIRVSKHVPHAFRNIGATEGRLMIIAEPAGLEEFFTDLAQLAGPPDPATVIPVFLKHGLELLGPPIDAD